VRKKKGKKKGDKYIAVRWHSGIRARACTCAHRVRIELHQFAADAAMARISHLTYYI